MGIAIIKLGGMYLEWSSVVDAPITFGMKLAEFEAYYLDEYGCEEMRNLPARIARVNAKGTSAYYDYSVDDTIRMNRAGPDEIPLKKAEIIEWYCRRRKQPDKSMMLAYRARRRTR